MRCRPAAQKSRPDVHAFAKSFSKHRESCCYLYFYPKFYMIIIKLSKAFRKVKQGQTGCTQERRPFPFYTNHSSPPERHTGVLRRISCSSCGKSCRRFLPESTALFPCRWVRPPKPAAGLRNICKEKISRRLQGFSAPFCGVLRISAHEKAPLYFSVTRGSAMFSWAETGAQVRLRRFLRSVTGCELFQLAL